jgi:hypothetical protein
MSLPSIVMLNINPSIVVLGPTTVVSKCRYFVEPARQGRLHFSHLLNRLGQCCSFPLGVITSGWQVEADDTVRLIGRRGQYAKYA